MLGKSISNWGDGTLDKIAAVLQQEMLGLRGFAASSMRKMRSFYLAWKDGFEICSLPTNKLTHDEMNAFMSIGFTHHYEIVSKVASRKDRLFL